jgi:hypothetical protein
VIGQLHAFQNGLVVLGLLQMEQILEWATMSVHLIVQVWVFVTVGVKNQLVQLVHHLLEQKLAHH